MKPSSWPHDEQATRSEQLLAERARQFAQTPVEGELTATTQVLLFRVRNEQYAVELQSLDSVQSPHGLTVVPCTPPRIAGIVNLRGEVITVVSMAVVLGLARESVLKDGAQILLVQLTQGRVGLLVDQVVGIGELALDRLTPSLAGNEYTVGIDQGATVLLRLDHLLTADRLEVLEHVE